MESYLLDGWDAKAMYKQVGEVCRGDIEQDCGFRDDGI